MAGLDPAIHDLPRVLMKRTWMPGTSPGMTNSITCLYLFQSGIVPRATSRFQMNSTISAPIVAVMKPAP